MRVLVGICIFVFLVLAVSRAVEFAKYERQVAQAKVYCAFSPDPHACFEVAMQEGIEAVMAP